MDTKNKLELYELLDVFNALMRISKSLNGAYDAEKIGKINDKFVAAKAYRERYPQVHALMTHMFNCRQTTMANALRDMSQPYLVLLSNSGLHIAEALGISRFIYIKVYENGDIIATRKTERPNRANAHQQTNKSINTFASKYAPLANANDDGTKPLTGAWADCS